MEVTFSADFLITSRSIDELPCEGRGMDGLDQQRFSVMVKKTSCGPTALVTFV